MSTGQQPAQQPVCDLCEGTGVAVDYEGGRSMGCPRGCPRKDHEGSPNRPAQPLDVSLLPMGDSHPIELVKAGCDPITGKPAQLLAKHQPCGCIVCTCADDVRCHGCGAWHCGTHPVSEIPNAVYEQPAQPGSGEVRVRRFWAEDLPSMDVEVVFAQDFDRLQSALTAAKAYADDMEARYHTAHERLTAAQQRIAELERDLENERARGIHSCHDQCRRPLCVANRRIRELESGLSEAIEIMARGERLLPKGESRLRLILENKEPS